MVRSRRNLGKGNKKDLPSKLSCLLEQERKGKPLIRTSVCSMLELASLHPEDTVSPQRVETWD